MRVGLVSLLLITTVLAGCASNDPAPTEFVDPDSVTLKTGKGAISGLVVDDRYRPIVGAKILLQETAQQTTSTQNGEFSFIDLEPGKYTLRTQSEGHEAAPKTVTVDEGQFAEASIVAQRVTDIGGTIVTQEYAVFAFCSVNALLPLSDACGLVDLSGDSDRIFLSVDYSALSDSLSVLITEFWAKEPGDFYILMGRDLASLGAQYYMNEYVNGQYTKCLNIVGELYEPCLDTNLGTPFSVNSTIDYILYINGMMDDEINNIAFGLPLTGVGARFAVQGKFLLSAFLGEPEVDIDAYCVLCDSPNSGITGP